MRDVTACELLAGGQDNWRNSVLAIELATGKIRWGERLGGPDAWNAACFQVGVRKEGRVGGGGGVGGWLGGRGGAGRLG